MHKPQLAIAAAAVLMAAPALAQTEPVVIEGGLPTARVSYADLNIGSPAGRHALEGRVASAAAGLCLENNRESIDEYMAEHQCFAQAMAKARSDIGLAVARAGTQLASARTILVAVK